MGEPVKHMHDAESRAAIDKACAEIAKALADRDMWKASWRIEVDGCVFKFKIDGYPKFGTPKRVERERYLAELSAEADAYEASAISSPESKS
jgi:hypothetical protein